MKKLIALLLALVMVFSLVACAAEKKGSSGKKNPGSAWWEDLPKDEDDNDEGDKADQGDKDNNDKDDEGDKTPSIGGGVEAPYDVDINGQFVYGNYFEDVTIDWWISSNYEISSDMYIFTKLEEKIGCKFNIRCYSPEDYKIKINTALNTNSLPEICAMTTDHNVYNIYGEQGAFVNLLDEYALNRMPNFQQNVLDYYDATLQIERLMSSSGALYAFPRYNTERLVNYGWMYRQDIFEKHGIAMWYDSESFLNVLRQLKTLYPESYPLTGASMPDVFNRLIASFGVNSTTTAYDWDMSEWYLAFTDQGFYNMLTVFKTAWEEGLIDPDIFNNKVNNIDEAIINGTSFVYNSWIGRMNIQNTYGQTYDPSFQVSYAPHIGNGMGMELPLVSSTNVVINAQSSPIEIDACLAIWDYLYSAEGVYATTVGEVGVTHKVVNGQIVYLNVDGSVMENATIQTLEEQYGMFNTALYVLPCQDSVYFTYTPEESEAQIIGSWYGLVQSAPIPSIPEDYAEEYYDLLHTLQQDVALYCRQFIVYGYSQADWHSQFAMWNSKYERLFDILNGNY